MCIRDRILAASYENGGKLLVAGNGGSCADAEHIVGELMKGFVKKRTLSVELQEKLKAEGGEKGEELAASLQSGLPAIALTGHTGLATAFLNDVNGEMIYAQQVCGYGREGDVLLGISTSGNAKNIEYACITARAKGMKVIGLTGKNGGCLKGQSDVCLLYTSNSVFFRSRSLTGSKHWYQIF